MRPDGKGRRVTGGQLKVPELFWGSFVESGYFRLTNMGFVMANADNDI